MPVVATDYVSGLYIAVEYSRFVERLNSFAKLRQSQNGFALGESSVGCRSSLYVFADYIAAVFVGGLLNQPLNKRA